MFREQMRKHFFLIGPDIQTLLNEKWGDNEIAEQHSAC